MTTRSVTIFVSLCRLASASQCPKIKAFRHLHGSPLKMLNCILCVETFCWIFTGLQPNDPRPDFLDIMHENTHVTLRYHLQHRLATVVSTSFTVPPCAGIFLGFTKRDWLPTSSGKQVAEDADKEMLSQIGTKTERLYPCSDSHLSVNEIQRGVLPLEKCRANIHWVTVLSVGWLQFLPKLSDLFSKTD